MKATAGEAPDLRDAIVAALREPSRRAPSGEGGRFAEAASRERVLVLLGSLLQTAGTLGEWPPAFVESYRSAQREAAAVDAIRDRELAAVLGALAVAHIRVLVFKGTALALTHYASPMVRERTDTDLLIEPRAAESAGRVLERLGYRRQHESSGRLLSYQSHYGRDDRFGVFHAIDLHWKISNRQAFADVLTFDDLWSRRVALPQLRGFGSGASSSAAFTTGAFSTGTSNGGAFAGDASEPETLTIEAFAPGAVDALMLALLHRAGHHPGSRDVRWLYDLHLLAGSLTSAEHDAFVRLTHDRGVEAMAIEGLRAAGNTFGTPAAVNIISRLESRTLVRPPARLFRAGVTHAALLGDDLRALPTWRARAQLLREHLCPPADYVRGKYGVSSTLALPALYAWRAIAGVPRWLLRGPAPRP